MHFVASDFDGTIFINETVTDSDILAINKFRENNNNFSICTGRPIYSVLPELKKYNIPFDNIIGVNGAVAVDSEGNELYSHNLEAPIVEQIDKILFKHDINNYILSDGYEQIKMLKGSFISENHIDLNNIRAYYIDGINASNALQLSNDINSELEKAGIIAYPNNEYVAIGMKGIHKGYGIQKTTELLNWTGQIHAIGDDYNDIPMFKRYNSYGIISGVPDAISFAKNNAVSVTEALNKITDIK